MFPHSLFSIGLFPAGEFPPSVTTTISTNQSLTLLGCGA